MKRREFLSISLPATGLALVNPDIFRSQKYSEINRQFSDGSSFDEYDIIINGAGLAGYFAAIHAVRRGKKVLIVDKRTYPGYEITAKRKLWLDARGIENLRPDLIRLFLPSGEKQEIQISGGEVPESSRFGDEILLFAGSVKKEMLRSLLVEKVDVLLMTDVCGVFSQKNSIKGVLLAGKHGLKAINCKSFIDTSDNLIFSRKLLGDPCKVKKAGFVLELSNVNTPRKKTINVSAEFGLIDNCLKFHQGKSNEKQLFVEFEFPADKLSFNEIEHRSRLISADIGRKLTTLDESLRDAKITQFASECSVSLENIKLPDPLVTGYYMLSGGQPQLSCETILKIENAALQLINKVKYSQNKDEPGELVLPGTKIPISDLSFSDHNETGLSIPMKNCSFDFKQWVRKIERCQVLVAGGGTAGAIAAMGAGEKGVKTVVVDYFNDLGGTKTMGGVMSYYIGIRDHNFLVKQEEDSSRVATENNLSMQVGRKLYHLKAILNAGGNFISGSIICGTLVNEKKVEGILICNNGELGTIQGDITIDATGDGDIAFFGGANHSCGNDRTGKTQNYSQWDIPVAGKLPSPINRDYDIIDNTRISELQRGLFLSHYEAHYYDFHPLLSVRESRRIEGLYTLDLVDVVEGTHFDDMISRAKSDFDPHYVGVSEFSRCGFLLPHSNLLTTEIPYRCIVPKNLDGLLISGKAIGVSHNALQFTRMSGDILILGYLTGQIAADIAGQNLQPRNYNVSAIQKEWAQLGFIPEDYNKKMSGNLIKNRQEIIRRVKSLAEGERDYLYKCIRVPGELILPVLHENYIDSKNSQGKLLIAKAMSWFGEKEGTGLIEEELNQLFKQELKDGYPGGYIEDYDLIRDRPKNQLQGLFWRINQNIALLAMAGDIHSDDSIKYIIENTSSGGPMFKWTGEGADYNNERIDLRLIPFHNRILNLCFYTERMANPAFIPSLERLLTDENIKGYCTQDYYLSRWRFYGGDLELSIAASLARCGSQTGYELLIKYLNDIHFNSRQFSASELKVLTNADYGYDPSAWLKHIGKLVFPGQSMKLRKEIEV